MADVQDEAANATFSTLEETDGRELISNICMASSRKNVCVYRNKNIK